MIKKCSQHIIGCLLLIMIFIFGVKATKNVNSFKEPSFEKYQLVDYMDTSKNELSFKLDRIIEMGKYKYISIIVENNSSSNYSFGWVRSCSLMVETDEGTFSYKISSGKIEEGSRKYDYFLEAPGKVKSIYYSDIRLLKGDLPVSNSSSIEYVNTSDYQNVYGRNILKFIACLLGVLLIIFVALRIKNGPKVTRITGNLISAIAIVFIVYSIYCYMVKPALGQADFSEVSNKYWVLIFFGLILLAIGNKMRGKKGYSSNSQFNSNFMQNQMENQRLFDEQVQRNNQEFQRQCDEFQQQQFNDMNNMF